MSTGAAKPTELPYPCTLEVRDACLCLHVQRAARALARRFDEAFRPLDLTNGRDLANLLDRGAAALHTRHPDWPADRWVEWLYVSALSRKPTAAELALAREMDLADLLWAVLMLPEFQLAR